MTFLKGCVRTLIHNANDVTDEETGTTRRVVKPLHFQYINQLHGFPMTQEYPVVRKQKIKPYMFCAEVRSMKRQQITIAVDAEEEKVMSRRALNGVAANHTHQADAQHLALSVCKALDKGITDFFLIHDSFGCLPCDMPVFLMWYVRHLSNCTMILMSGRMLKTKHWHVYRRVEVMQRSTTPGGTWSHSQTVVTSMYGSSEKPVLLRIIHMSTRNRCKIQLVF